MITMHVARLARSRYSRSTQLKPGDSSYGHDASYRSQAVGRKNWLFIGSLRARVRSASLMSLVRGGARVPRARATRHGRSGRRASCTESGTSGAPQRQIVRQKIHVRSGVYPWVSWALRTRSLSIGDLRLSRIACHCTAGSAGATSRSIHLEPVTGRGHISEP
jgi:hypothetical protein